MAQSGGPWLAAIGVRVTWRQVMVLMLKHFRVIDRPQLEGQYECDDGCRTVHCEGQGQPRSCPKPPGQWIER